MKKHFRVAALAAVAAAAIATPALGFHTWNNYHWKRTSAQITPYVGFNLSGQWPQYSARVVSDWNKSIYIESPSGAGSTNPKNCKAVSGTIQVCNSRYGQNGWLGIAQIWLSGGHIAQGITKLNDSYFDTAKYNTPAWRRLVYCQEVGHDYGLGHTDETFDNANHGTCMDYTNDPDGTLANPDQLSNEYPYTHDYQELESMYKHSDGASATNFGVREVGRGAAPASNEAIGGNSPAEWGRAVHRDGYGRPDVYVQDLPSGGKKITHVFWTLEHRGGGNHDH